MYAHLQELPNEVSFRHANMFLLVGMMSFFFGEGPKSCVCLSAHTLVSFVGALIGVRGYPYIGKSLFW